MKIHSKSPSVSIEIVRDSVQGNYSFYTITANGVYLEELPFKDILYIRNQLSVFINQAKKKGGKL